jgi:hypothetical protein
LLADAARRVVASDDVVRAYVDAVDTIGSDSQARAALSALADAGDLAPTQWRMLLQGALAIGSDSQCASLLTAIAPRLPRDEETLAAYRRALATVGSTSQARRAEEAIGMVRL